MKLKLGKDGFEDTKDRITVESFENGPIAVSVLCDRNECCETAESMEQKACDYISNMVGQHVEPLSFGADAEDHAYETNDNTYYDIHNFSVRLKL